MISLNYPPVKSTSRVQDLFPEAFDVVVHGAGFTGYAAAKKLALRGQRVLLSDAGGQLLWESSAALENGLTGNASGADWTLWLKTLEAQSATSDGVFDSVVAEMTAARELAQSDAIRTLLYAVPVSAQHQDDSLAAIVFATKEGFRRVRARNWVDATENGALVNCILGQAAPALEPESKRCRIVFQSADWQPIDKFFAEYAEARGMQWRKAVRATERHLVWEDEGEPWHQAVLKRLRHVRESVGVKGRPLVSHTSQMAFPVYGAAQPALPANLPPNLLVLSPALAGEGLRSIPERYQRGADAVESFRFASGRMNLEVLPDLGADSLLVRQELDCDVMVAGSGTAGSLAILAAASQGADTVALEFAPFPGGIGTGGGITGYFYGLPGGRQEALGRLTAELTELFLGSSYEVDERSWHHEAKKVAILTEFDSLGVRFFGESLLCGAELDGGTVQSVLAMVKGALTRVSAQAFVDSTGDGDLCSYAGADFTSGRMGDSRTLAFSQAAFTLNRDRPEITVRPRNFDAGWVNATDALDLSRARLTGIAQYYQDERDETMLPLLFAPLLGIRESRHIVTDYTLRMDDLISERHFEDAIGRAGAHADTHSVDFEFEDDETVFFYWVCRLFRYPLRAQLPYRMLLPRGLKNVWIACRAAGMSANVFYGIRMQRDMQRLGEAAGAAAALASRNGGGGQSRAVSIEMLRAAMAAFPTAPVDALERAKIEEPLAHLAKGESGVPLWLVYRNRAQYREAVVGLLDSPLPNASFYAACILAMWEEPLAEARLVAAIQQREEGETDPSENMGAYGQEIDIPFWLLAVILLRCCGTAQCVPALQQLAKEPDNILNVRSSLALTLERLVDRQVISPADAEQMIERLAGPMADRTLSPSHSIARTLRKQEQKQLTNHYLPPVREDHAWQLHLVLCRIRLKLGLTPHEEALAYQQDERNFVRQAFAGIGL